MIRAFPNDRPISEASVNRAVYRALEGRYYEAFVIVGEVSEGITSLGISCWRMVLSPHQKADVGIIEKSVAMEIIRANEMTRVYTSEEGRVYECPDRPFAQWWEGYYATQRLEQYWSYITTGRDYPGCPADELIWAEYRGTNTIEMHGPMQVLKYLSDIYKQGTTTFEGAAFLEFLENRNVIYNLNRHGKFEFED